MANSNNSKNELFSKIDEVAHSSKGKNIFIYLLFLCVAFIFWIMLALNDEIQKDYTLPFEIVEVPDSVTLLEDLPKEISVSIRDKGSSLIKYSLGNVPSIKLKFKDITTLNNRLIINQSNIGTLLQTKFGSNAQIISFSPDSIKSLTTTLPGKKIKLIISTDINPNPQYTICGDIIANVDTIKLYSQNPIPDTLTSISTKKIVAVQSTDTLTETIGLNVPFGIKAVPSKVVVTIPIEPLIIKHISLPISSTSSNNNERIVIFPSKCNVSYLTPMSKYNELPQDIKLSVSYNQSDYGKTKLPIILNSTSKHYQDITISPDSVEFIIEQND